MPRHLLLCLALTGLFATLSAPLHCQQALPLPSPLHYGLDTATTGEARYWALYHAHRVAVAQNSTVDYRGVGNLDIAIPADAKTIPLPKTTDFRGITLTITCNEKDFTLFSLSGTPQEITLPQSMIDSSDFSSIPQLASGRKLLIVQDRNPWTKRAGKGFDYLCYRNDIICVEDGRALNKTVMPYGDTATTHAVCHVVEGNGSATPYVVENLTVHRAAGNKYKAYVLRVAYCENVLLRHITIVTPRDKKKIADAAISLAHCANLQASHITIDGTYSQEHEYGYGIAMNNVLNSHFSHIVSRHCGWGLFGTNNVAQVTLDSCDVNRFDIHCYGRDVTLRRTRFSDVRVPYGSVYGHILYDSCTFYHSVPLYIRPRYNAHVPFDITMRNCTFVTAVARQRNKILDMGHLNPDVNPRPELATKCWPNVHIENMTVEMGRGVRKLYLFRIENGRHDTVPLSHCHNIVIDGFRMVGRHRTLYLCNKEDVVLQGPVRLELRNMGDTKVINSLIDDAGRP